MREPKNAGGREGPTVGARGARVSGGVLVSRFSVDRISSAFSSSGTATRDPRVAAVNRESRTGTASWGISPTQEVGKVAGFDMRV